MLGTITIVVAWFGRDTAGGAETQAHQLAGALRAAGAPVEVWATTGRDSFAPPDLAHYHEGMDTLDGVPVRRFAITPPARDPRIPPPVARRPALLAALPNFPDHELRLLASLVSSDALLEAIASAEAGRRFLFIPYPFPTSFWGTLLAGERAHLLPCLHDEPYARYQTYRWMFRHARRVLANSPAERDLARRLYDLPEDQAVVAGEGIDLTPRGDGAAFRARRGLYGPLLMYAGRRDHTKNIPLLLAYLREYWARRGGVTPRGVQVSPQAVQVSQQGMQVSPQAVQVSQQGAQVNPRDAQMSQQGVQVNPQGVQVSPQAVQMSQHSIQISPQAVQVSQKDVQVSPQGSTPCTLMLAGRDPLDIPPALAEIVLDLGYLSAQEKHDAYAAADIYIHPSVHESFSIVLMEAWLQGTPALVHADCAVTREAAHSSGAGLTFRTFGEFAAALDLLLARADLRRELGARGRAFVLETCRWEDVARRTIEAMH